MGLKARLLMIGLGSIVGLTTVLLVSAAWRSSGLTAHAQEELTASGNADLSHLAQSAYNMVKCQDETLRDTVDHSIKVAQNLVKTRGGVELSGSKTWTATNQLSKAKEQVTLPIMSIGGKALAGNAKVSVKTPVVDDITDMVGGMATVFQRVNKQGDMLRVATNVVAKNGNRAIGTYIPATNPDGKPNPVVSALLDGRPFHGMAYVVDNWCVTAYEPLRDAAGEIVGAIFVGVRQESIPSLRNAIIGTKIGQSGYIWVISTKGETNGQYVMSKGGSRDGEYLLDAKDAQGKSIIKEMIEKGLKQQPGKVFLHTYPWKDADSAETKTKRVAAAYYEPWGWLIGATAYEDEFLAPVTEMRTSGWQTISLLVVTGILAMGAAGYGFGVFAGGLARRLGSLADVAKAVARGDVEEANNILQAGKKEAA